MSYKEQKLTEPKIDKPSSYDEYKIVKDFDKVVKSLEKVIKKFKVYEVDSSSVPSAPNTGMFFASRSGKLEMEINMIHHGGYYGFNRNFIIAIKIGSNINLEIQEQIKEAVYKVIKPYHQYNSSDAGVYCNYEYGTNYDTYGLISPFRINKK